ncbi:MAG TPA: class I SAM-dependent methyltransferase [Kofleriaceae bacterium]|nr:class I SAM-dependent methyltransferase [Kofleriaceae bacterium]
MADKDSRAGARYADAAILDYTNRVHGAHDAGLERAFSAPDREDIPAIQVGQGEGRLLEILLRMVGARRVVEIGTLAGYSAIRCARALGEGGKVWTLELLPAHAEVARQNIEAAGLADRVEVLVGEAHALLPGLEQHAPLDAVFIDADKEGYAEYGRWAARNLRPGGLLIGDNAFLFGNLLDDTPAARAMRRFHEEAPAEFESVCIPTPDGLLVGIKR